jgi:hypothetical protein
MSEGLGPAETSKEIKEHQHKHRGDDGDDRRDRTITIIEASLLAMVALLAAACGYASAKWSTESRLFLAEASTARSEANRAFLEADALRDIDGSMFNTWFDSWVADDADAMRLAEKRFRPEYRVAFDAWFATDPETNPDAPPGPGYMPEYKLPPLEQGKALDAKGDELFHEGQEAGETADDFVKATVFLATVLFLVGISGHFRVRAARVGLVAVGVVILGFAVVQLVSLPWPPS